MIDEEIRKYILEGKWENQYPSAIEYLLLEVKRLQKAFITAVNHVGEPDLSRDDLFSKLDDDLFSLWLFRSE